MPSISVRFSKEVAALIFVSVGTHEQQMNRLFEELDRLIEKGVITEKVIAQTGYSDYKPKHMEWSKFYPYAKTQQLAAEAHILITHGGPSSFVMGLQNGKTPIVVPRKASLNEHVNDHQVKFCHAVEERCNNIIVVDDVKDLGEIIEHYDEIAASKNVGLNSNNAAFCAGLENIALKLAGENHA